MGMDPDVGARIRRLREAAGIRAQDLASRADLDPTALSKVENGRRGVKSTELARIAAALRVSPLALLQDDSVLASFPVAERSAERGTADGAAFDRLRWLAELNVVLSDAGIRTSPDLAPIPSVVGLDWLEAATTLSEWALAHLPLRGAGDRRLAEFADLIEDNLKVDVLIEPFANDPLSGAAITDRTFPLLFVNSDHPRPRALFTLAHELGHLLAQTGGGDVVLDRDLAGSTDSERLANAFAARYLMPETELRQLLDSYHRVTPTLVLLTDHFGVSYETLVYHLHNLRLIDDEGRDRLMAISWQQLVAVSSDTLRSRGYKQSTIGKLFARGQLRPAGRPPALLVRRAIEGYRKGILSVRPLAGLLHEDPEELLSRLSAAEHLLDELDDLDSGRMATRAEDKPEEELFAGSPI